MVTLRHSETGGGWLLPQEIQQGTPTAQLRGLKATAMTGRQRLANKNRTLPETGHRKMRDALST